MTDDERLLTDQEKKSAVTNAPKCSCFDFDDDAEFAMGRCCEASGLSTKLATLLLGAVRAMDMCDAAIPFVMDTFLIVVATHLATKGTVIERGTQEALWETERVLQGTEARVLTALRAQYAMSQRMGLTEAKVAAMRADGRIQ